MDNKRLKDLEEAVSGLYAQVVRTRPKGEKGDGGEVGKAGKSITGARGRDGKNGIDGRDGFGHEGKSGRHGRDGEDGKDGTDGKDGAKGERGERGEAVHTHNGGGGSPVLYPGEIGRLGVVDSATDADYLAVYRAGQLFRFSTDTLATYILTGSTTGVENTYLILSSDDTIKCTGGLSFTVTLPPIEDVREGKIFDIKHMGTGVITVAAQTGEYIDLVAATLINAGQAGAYPNRRVKKSDNEWIIV